MYRFILPALALLLVGIGQGPGEIAWPDTTVVKTIDQLETCLETPPGLCMLQGKIDLTGQPTKTILIPGAAKRPALVCAGGEIVGDANPVLEIATTGGDQLLQIVQCAMENTAGRRTLYISPGSIGRTNINGGYYKSTSATVQTGTATGAGAGADTIAGTFSVTSDDPSTGLRVVVDDVIRLTSGNGAGQLRRITAATDAELTVHEAWNIAPANGDGFVINGGGAISVRDGHFLMDGANVDGMVYYEATGRVLISNVDIQNTLAPCYFIDTGDMAVISANHAGGAVTCPLGLYLDAVMGSVVTGDFLSSGTYFIGSTQPISGAPVMFNAATRPGPSQTLIEAWKTSSISGHLSVLGSNASTAVLIGGPATTGVASNVDLMVGGNGGLSSWVAANVVAGYTAGQPARGGVVLPEKSFNISSGVATVDRHPVFMPIEEYDFDNDSRVEDADGARSMNSNADATKEIFLNASSGIAFNPDDASSIEANISNADNAAYGPVGSFTSAGILCPGNVLAALTDCLAWDATQLLFMDLDHDGVWQSGEPRIGSIADKSLDELQDLDSTQALTARINVIDDSAGQTFDALKDTGCTLFTNAGAGGLLTYTLPTPAVGMCVTVAQVAGQQVRVDPGASEEILRLGNGNGKYIESTVTVGDLVRLVAISATDWLPVGEVGTWTAEP